MNLQRDFASLVRGLEFDERRELEAARRDPARHKLTRLMEGSARYRFWSGGVDRRGRTVRFCYCTGRNVAGYYLTWREVVTPAKRHGKYKEGDLVSTTTRDQWAARKVRRKAAALAQQRAQRFRAVQDVRKPSAGGVP